MHPPLLFPTPPDRLVDAAGHPYFLWDVPRMTLDELRTHLADPDPAARAWWIGKVLAQARPDDALMLIHPREIVAHWHLAERNLGRNRDLWTWLVARWKRLGLVAAP